MVKFFSRKEIIVKAITEDRYENGSRYYSREDIHSYKTRTMFWHYTNKQKLEIEDISVSREVKSGNFHVKVIKILVPAK